MPTPTKAIRSVTTKFRKSQTKDTGHYFRNGMEEDELSIITITPPSLQSSSSQVQVNADGTMNLVDERGAMPVVTSSSLSPNPTGIAAEQPLRTIDLPKHSPSADTVNNAKMLWDLELVLGRTAMVLGVLMMVGEIFFGISPLVS